MENATKVAKRAKKKIQTKTPKRTGPTCPKCREPAHRTGNKIKCEACNETFTTRTLRLDVIEDRAGRPAQRERKIGYFDQKGVRVHKDFFQEHWSEAKQRWVRGIPEGFEIYLWHVRKLLLAPQEDWIVFAEGIKCAESMEKLGYIATTNLFGARAWHSEWYNEDLRDRRVAIFCDRDDPGEKGREKIAIELHGITAETRLIHLDGDLPEKTDVTDLIEDHKWTRKDFDDLIDKTPAFAPKETGDRIITVALSDVEAVPVQWLWYPRFALGKLALLVGNPGVGKSFLSLDMAARLSIGDIWPDWENLPENANRSPKASVLIMTAEDGLADTVRPRLDKMGADCSKIFAVEGVYYKPEKEVRDFPGEDEIRATELFDLSRDIELLEKKVIQIGDVKLIIIDPLSAYYGSKIDTNQSALVRSVLTPLAKMAERHDVCILGIAHLRKSAADAAIYRVTGSIGQAAAARTIWLIHPDKENENRRRFLCLKNNLARDKSGLAFQIDDGRVEYESGKITETAEDIFQDDSNQGPGLQVAIEFLHSLFADDPNPKATDVYEKARKANISSRTLERAKAEMKITSKKQKSSGIFRWERPDDSS